MSFIRKEEEINEVGHKKIEEVPLIEEEINKRSDNNKESVEKSNINALLQDKLRDPNKQISLENSINLLLHCVQLGDEEAIKAKDKEIVIFIGNTGSGKSTTINFIYGCSMVLKTPKELGVKGIKKLVVVLPRKDGGTILEMINPFKFF